jgi:hypothetical protein
VRGGMSFTSMIVYCGTTLLMGTTKALRVGIFYKGSGGDSEEGC